MNFKHFLLPICLFGLAILSSCNNKLSKDATSSNPIISEQDALTLVKPFYDFLGGDSTPEQVKPSYHDDWLSFYSNTGSRTIDETLDFVSGPLAQMVPDLKWEIKEVYITSSNQIIIRGEATGTPVGKSFMGTPMPGGKSFTIMSVDIHELKDGKIAKTYHVEDWLNAIQQVAAE